MNLNAPTDYHTLALPLARYVDEACDRFEEAWRSGPPPPRIEDFLGDVAEPGRPVLLAELIQLDLHYRREDYHRRFPGLAVEWPTEPAGRERYTLIRPHAEGGIGRVSLHRDRELGRDVALKELHPEKAADPKILSAFLQEAQITSQLEHPGIVPVYELVRPAADRRPFYTMRFVNGRTLTEATRSHHQKRLAGEATALDLHTLLNTFVSVCQTVAYAHSRGVIHRDLKGQNVVLGDFGEVIVLDWGLAKVLGGETATADQTLDALNLNAGGPLLSVDGEVKGTPLYMAPEQAAGRVDLTGPATDVYGLGAILYEILTGQPPFTGSTPAVLRQVRESDPRPPCEVVRDVPAALEAACLRAMAKNPAARQPSASDLAAEVQRWLAESAERSRAVQERERFFNLSLDLLCTIGFDHHIKQLNPAWETTLGWTRDELMARPYADFVHPDDRAATLAESERIAAGQARPAFENRYRTKGGAERWISWTASRIPGEPLIYAVGRDVTALRKSQERFELAVRGSGDGLWDWDVVTNENYTSPRWKSMLGYEDHELTHNLDEWTSRLHPDDHDRAVAALRACADGLTPSYEIEYRLRHKDGSYRWILDRGVALLEGGKAYRMAGSHADITERKQMEQALRESEENHRAVLAQAAAELRAARGS